MVKIIFFFILILYPLEFLHSQRRIYSIKTYPKEIEIEDFIVEQELDKKSIYAGEQLTYTFRFFRGRPVEDTPRLRLPDYSDFMRVDLDRKKEKTTGPGGQTYILTERKFGFFPMRSGRFKIEPAQIKLIVEGVDGVSGVFQFTTDEELKLETGALLLEVKPLPAKNRPADFSGGVGDFTFKVQTDKEGPISKGEAVTLIKKIKGRGDLRLIKSPDLPHLPDFKVMGTDSDFDIKNKANNVYSKRTFKTTLVPVSSGVLRVPPVIFNYFNPYTKKYITKRSQPVSFKVEAATREVAESKINRFSEDKYPMVNGGISDITLNMGRPFREPIYDRKIFRVLAGIPIYIWILALLYKFSNKYIFKPAYPKLRKKREINKKFKEAKDKLNKNQIMEVYKIIENISGEPDKLPPEGESIVARSRKIIYSPDYRGNKRSAARDLNKIKKIIKKSIKILIVLVGTSPVVGWGNVREDIDYQLSEQKIFKTANEFYKENEFELAVQKYNTILKYKIYEGILYNLGNSYWHLNKPGKARLYWERAYEINPFNKKTVQNINLVKKFTGNRGGTLSIYSGFKEYFSFEKLVLLSVFWGWIFSLSFLGFYILKDKKYIWVGIGGFIIFSCLAGYMYIYSLRDPPPGPAVIIEETSIYSDFDDRTSVAGRLSEGNKVLILQFTDNWAEVILEYENRRIWVPAEKLEKI